jgi:hypothetical protein
MRTRKTTIEKYKIVFADAFEKRRVFTTQKAFCTYYKVSNSLAKAALEFYVLQKTENGYIVKSIPDSKEIRLINKRTYELSHRSLFESVNKTKTTIKPKIQTQKTYGNKKTEVKSPFEPYPINRKFKLFWGLLEFEY